MQNRAKQQMKSQPEANQYHEKQMQRADLSQLTGRIHFPSAEIKHSKYMGASEAKVDIRFWKT